MNRKQRKKQLEQRRNPDPSPAMQAYAEISADHQDPGYIRVLMAERGYLPRGTGWRTMTERERKKWQ